MELGAALEGLGVVADPRRIGRYALHYRLAQGGMGAVYLARLRGEGGFAKWVAVKVIHQHSQDDPKAVAMFLDEARIASQLEHPNVCRVSDFGEVDGTWFLAMELLVGESLGTLIKHAPSKRGLPFGVAARVLADAARGLHAAHELKGSDGLLANVVHRDVSPANVFVLYDGMAKVLDFGIAKARTRLAAKTRDGTVKGNFGYVAPESFKRAEVDRRADVYSLGVVLWEATTGRKLFKGGPVEIMGAALDGAPRPSTVVEGYPEGLEAIVMRALSVEPEKRFATADAMARELERWGAQAGVFVGQGEVSDFMCGAFAERRAWREALLRHEPAALGDESKEGFSTLTGMKSRQAAAAPLPSLPSLGAGDEAVTDDHTVAEAALPDFAELDALRAKNAAASKASPLAGISPELEAKLRNTRVTDEAATVVYNPRGTPAAGSPSLRPPAPAPAPAPTAAAARSAAPAPAAGSSSAALEAAANAPASAAGLRASSLFDFTFEDMQRQRAAGAQALVEVAPTPIAAGASAGAPAGSAVRSVPPPAKGPASASAASAASPAAAPTDLLAHAIEHAVTRPKRSGAGRVVLLVLALLALAGGGAAVLLLRK